ncbi:MAG: hypothetical protein GQ522_02660 [Deltaproteobacteria bacterium]|nr:hypothetical protein [Deltaproteobacteria bacterium]
MIYREKMKYLKLTLILATALTSLSGLSGPLYADGFANPERVWAMEMCKAVRGNQVGRVRKLLTYNKKTLNARHGACAPPLHEAANLGRAEITRILIRGGADINLQDVEGSTPLHRAAAYTAAYQGAEENVMVIVMDLIESGAHLHVKDRAGRTAVELAAEVSHNDLARFLREEIARTEALRACRNGCEERAKKGELKEGMTVRGCIKKLCI